MIVGLGGHLAWRVTLAGYDRINHHSSVALVGAADLKTRLLLAGGEGQIFLAGGDGEPAIDLNLDPSFGMAAAPNGRDFSRYGEH